VFSFVLTDGGTALLFWGFIVIGLGMMLVYASLAEMASMYVCGSFTTTKTIKLIFGLGVPQLAGSIIGSANLRPQSTRKS
jgi:amino acid permease